MLFQLIEIESDERDQVIAETKTLPLFELREHAMAMAEFSAARCHGDYGYDADRDCWWAASGTRTVRYLVRPLPELDAAA